MSMVDILHRFKVLRTIGRKFAQRLSVSQPFYDGKIYLNAVQHKWAYLNGMTIEKHDHELQQYIFKLSKGFETFIDIGCNVGVITISTLLHNKQIKAISIDPSKTAITLVTKSLKANKLQARCNAICAAVGATDGFTYFNDNYGSAMAAIESSGEQIPQVKFSGLLNKYGAGKTLVKIDIEGFETIIMEDLGNVNNLRPFTFILEVHPLNYHQGNPEKVFDLLTKNKAIIKTLENIAINSLPTNEITQVLVEFE